jgi:hypothetical protein
MGHPTIQQIMKKAYPAYEKIHALPYHVRKAARALMICRTAELGGHMEACPEGHYQRHWYNSCGHRFCPQCKWMRITEWLERQKERLLPCGHYHMIFTIPHDLNDIWLLNVRAMTNLLFTCMRDTLFEFFSDPKHIGAKPGIIATLHTWTQTMALHLHLHCIVTEGGLCGGEWKETRQKGYLLPIEAVMMVFRGKFLAYMNDAVVKGTITLPLGMTLQQWKNLRNKLGRMQWNVRIETRYDHGKGVLIYLSRYIRGGAMSNSRIASVTDKAVTFTYKNGDRSKTETMPLSVTEFIQRYLLHVPAAHTKIVRYYGLYATTAKEELALCRSLIGERPVSFEEIKWQSPKNVYPTCCPVCGRSFVHYIDPPYRREVIPNAA